MSNTLRDIISNYLPDWAKDENLTPEERDKRLKEMKLKDLNDQEGNLKGADCQKCKNKGVIYSYDKDGALQGKNCQCRQARASLDLIEKSGLGEQVKYLTFPAFKDEKEWQKVFKKSAQEFTKNPKGKVFLAAGQCGAGKTHLCTAIVGELLKQNYACKYMRWKDESTVIKGLLNDDEYERKINPLKKIQVLYIDDFWKTKKSDTPTKGDINLAFELLNYRLGQRELVTIISTEKTREELFDIDEATAGRIFQYAGDFAVVIGFGKEKDFRRRDEQ